MDALVQLLKLSFGDKFYLIFISYFWLIGYSSGFWNRLGMDVDIANFVILLLLSLLSFNKWKNKIRLSDIFLYLIITILYFISSLIYPNTYDDIFSHAFEVVFVTFSFLFIGISFKNKEYSGWITTLSFGAIVINILYLLFFHSNVNDYESMNRAYILLPSVLYILWQCFEHFKFKTFLMFIIGFVLECSMGSRGPFVCILFFTAVYLLFFKRYKHGNVIRICIVGVSALLYFISTLLAELMIIIMSGLGMSTRIFDKVLNDALINYENSSGRDSIQTMLLKKLQQDDVGLGFGLFSDRKLTGHYAHNILIELWYSFGYMIGSLLLLLVLLLFVRFLFICKNNDSKIFALIFFTVTIIKMCFSGTFIEDPFLYFFIGYCIYGIREANKLQSL